MKKVIPFKKQIAFNTSIFEINSISLEHSLKCNNKSISGEFVISGDYKESDSVIINEPFIFNIPCDIELDDKYDTSNIKFDIDDFNYDIVNSNTLDINIMVSIDGLEEKEELIDIIDESNDNIIEEAYNRINEERNNEVIIDEPDFLIDDKISIIDNITDKKECYVTYHVHIYREDDSIDKIIKLYNTSKEELDLYNDISTLNIGSKLIIPSNERI